MSSFGRVVVIGAGLMGTSVGLALRRVGTEVLLVDRDPANLRLAVSLGAGTPYELPAPGTDPAEDRAADPAVGPVADLVVVGVPPAGLSAVISDALRRFPGVPITDLGSVKAPVAAEVTQEEPAAARWYAGGHPMAGSERSGPLAALADLFDGRPWAITPHPGSAPAAVAAVELLAKTCGGFGVHLTPQEHDEAVALVSHLPHVASSVVAGLLTDAADRQLILAGQGVRDVTRIAGGDPALWAQILDANARPVARLLRAAAEQLTAAADGLDTGALDNGVLERGVSGVRRLPGKHGVRVEEFTAVAVLLPDRPGELARLFADVGEAGINIEDVRIDHNPGTPAGLVELLVVPGAEHRLQEVLEQRGWSLHR